MTKKLYLPLLMAIVVALFSSCKKMGPLSADYFTVTPQVLEAVGGKVPATINGKFPEKYIFPLIVRKFRLIVSPFILILLPLSRKTGYSIRFLSNR